MPKKVTAKQFLEKARKIHGDKYDYSKIEYVDTKTKVCIICPKHGEFWQSPASHLKGHGCFQCGVENSAKGHLSNKDEFVKKAKKIFGILYDYSNVIYNKSSEKVSITCNKCGNSFLITPNNHLRGQGCPICAKEKKGVQKKETKTFIEEASAIHSYKYDYSNVVYLGTEKKVCINCPIHGEFWQTPRSHLSGQGCPICKTSKLEKKMLLALDKNKIDSIKHYKIKELNKQHLDFYLPEYNVAIECQGRQHIYPINFGKNRFKTLKEQLEHVQMLDKMKKEVCDKIGIKLLYYVGEDVTIDDLFKIQIYNKNNCFWDENNLIKSL